MRGFGDEVTEFGDAAEIGVHDVEVVLGGDAGYSYRAESAARPAIRGSVAEEEGKVGGW